MLLDRAVRLNVRCASQINCASRHGPGYRVYLSRQGSVLVLLLCGSDKSDQDTAIRQALVYLNDWKQRGQP